MKFASKAKVVRVWVENQAMKISDKTKTQNIEEHM
jgi:hypothetical protein